MIWASFQLMGQQALADPGKDIVLHTGMWSLYFLFFSLSITPLRLLGVRSLSLTYRRLFGLYAFTYACLHLLAYLTFILGWRLDLIQVELLERPYIWVGTFAFVILFILAMTSNRASQRRLKRNWARLHRGVYIAVIAVLIHYWMQVRAGYAEQLGYTLLLVLLFLPRLWKFFKKVKNTA
ncbi:protein-methionine-sulfoxide reductase heme-binding subunit MsrQ [Nitrincola tapanii]|nr:protein-methionine-sulfoxide reductase heme-binding subunit MsrQ [Nitrincola tapanii]